MQSTAVKFQWGICFPYYTYILCRGIRRNYKFIITHNIICLTINDCLFHVEFDQMLQLQSESMTPSDNTDNFSQNRITLLWAQFIIYRIKKKNRPAENEIIYVTK